MPEIITQIAIETRIFLIRGKKVMLDKDLAELYEVETRVLNQAVQRNIQRFPDDFMFQLSKAEFENLKSQFVISSWGDTGCFCRAKGLLQSKAPAGAEQIPVKEYLRPEEKKRMGFGKDVKKEGLGRRQGGKAGKGQAPA